ncbi:MAG: DUF262 domain-containing protein [Bacteroidia bacterium]
MNNNNTGEKYSFYKLVKDRNYFIEIPIIQRDYAQGRVEEVEVRTKFLNSLYNSLKDDSPIDLDFVYGSTAINQKNKFIPLDGQQRLTTLFLLHWYLAHVDNKKEEFRAAVTQDNLPKFTYETRATSRDFCRSLILKDIDIPTIGKSLSDTIRDSFWFFSAWESDPTIYSMLNMLDAIHEKFSDSKGFYNKLINMDEPMISFQFIELKNFGLSDNLYIKMNARGKELTHFENFKANFEQLVQKKELDLESSIVKNLSLKMDTVWTDLFWKYKNQKTNLFDDEIANFIRIIIANNFALRTQSESDFENLSLLVGDENSADYNERPKQIDFYKYEDLDSLDRKCISDIVRTFDLLSNGTEKIKKFLSDNSLLDEEILFAKAIRNSLNYTERVQIFALHQFLIFSDSQSNIEEWMRVVRNLSENTIYNNVEEYARDIKAVSTLIPHSNDILPHLTIPTNKIRGFNSSQIEEEQVKAILITKNDSWKTAVVNIENHGYFKGQIGFILKFSGITEFYLQRKSLDWDDENDANYFKSFTTYCDKSCAIFGPDGLKKFPDFLWERALLTKGDYLLSKGKNKSFLKDLDRDVSWKRLLRDDSTSRAFVNGVLDDLNVGSIESDLKKIIKSCTVNDWRRYFIEFPELIDVCGFNRFIRKDSEKDILLLEKTQTNGIHREYYSYALFIKLVKLGNKVAYVESNSIDNLKFICAINAKKVTLSFGFYTDSWQYKLKDDGQITFFKSENDVIEYLIKNNYLKQK